MMVSNKFPMIGEYVLVILLTSLVTKKRARWPPFFVIEHWSATTVSDTTFCKVKKKLRSGFRGTLNFWKIKVSIDNKMDVQYQSCKLTDPKAGRFYILPKTHKQGNPDRPIISSGCHSTERILEFVDYHLKLLVQALSSYMKDTTHFLPQLQNLLPFPDNALLVILDVSSIYILIFRTTKVSTLVATWHSPKQITSCWTYPIIV